MPVWWLPFPSGCQGPIEIVVSDDRQGDYFAELVSTKLNASRVAIVHDNSTFDAVTVGDRDFTTVISRMRAQNPDVVYFTAYYPEAGLFLRQMRDAGVDALFVRGNAPSTRSLWKSRESRWPKALW